MSSSIFSISSRIDHSLLSGDAREQAIVRMYADRFAVVTSRDYLDYDNSASSSSLGFRDWEFRNPSSEYDADYSNLVAHADALLARYSIDELRARARAMYESSLEG